MVAESNPVALLDRLDELRDRYEKETDPQEVVKLRFWLNELEDDMLAGYVLLEQEFRLAWHRWGNGR